MVSMRSVTVMAKKGKFDFKIKLDINKNTIKLFKVL